nr:tRNA (adenosine(37)-N6)-threonylcarbamoyltransferase complex ATPase subunit type 1 TsaE [uncultured Cetobacterium sp.]
MKKKLTFNEINELAKKLADYVDENSVVALIGDLGTGKTTFTKNFAKELGVTETLKSPTFNYVLEYLTGRLPLYHFDVYRLGSAEEIYEIGYEDYINNDGVSLIEWANIIETELPKKYIRIEFAYSVDGDVENEREVSVEYIGDKEKEEEILKYVGFSN